MPNPRAQKQVTLDRVTEDLKSLSQPLTAIADMMAGALRGSTAATLGAPGDIREIVDLVAPDTAQRVMGQRSFPTTEEMKAKLPPVVPQGGLPVRQHTAEIYGGLGEFMPLPGSGAVAAGLGRAVKAVPGALRHGAEEFAKASYAGSPRVVKPKGGNWLTGDVEKAVGMMKSQNYQIAPELLETFREGARDVADPQNARMVQRLREHEAENALNNWVDRNLTNYIKKEMATPEDPVRKLAEQGITHKSDLNDYRRTPGRSITERREAAGFPAEGLGVSELARVWENLADYSFMSRPAKDVSAERYPWVSKLDPETPVYGGIKQYINQELAFDHIIDVLREDLAAGRIRPEQLSKVSMEQAVRRTFEYDQEMAKKMAEAQIKATEGMPVYKEYPEGYKWIELALPEAKLDEGYRLVKDEPSISNWQVVPHPDGKGYAIRADNGQYGLSSSGGYAPKKWNTPDEAKAEISNYAEIQEVDPDEAFKVFDPSGNVIASGKSEKQALNQLNAEERTKVLENALKYEGETMGHCVGGYCPDVMEGRSRIYSLRDAKGEPHVTVEVNPRPIKTWDDVTAAVGKDEAAKLYDEFDRIGGYNMDNTDAAFDMFIKQKGIQAPERIVQIKGKQNRAPKEEYLPYVQDFVRSGQWSGVGDFQNTGLVRKSDLIDKFTPDELDAIGKGEYLTQGEYSDLLLKALQPPEGMKRGGKVSISDNCDCQMMEVEDKKFGKGGLAKEAIQRLVRAPSKTKEEVERIAERVAQQLTGEFVRGEKGTQSIAGKTQKQFAREKELKHDIKPTSGETKKPEKVDYEKLKDQTVIGIAGDPTITGQTLHAVGETPLMSPSPQHGGPLYGLYHDNDHFWASQLGAARRVQNLAGEAMQQYDQPVLGQYIMMGPESINYAQHFADANLSAINPSKMRKSDIEGFNKLIRKGSDASGPRPSFPGIENPEEAYLQFALDPELRKHFNALMQMPTVTERFRLPSGIDVRHAITEPELRDLETGVTGYSIGRMRPEVKELQLSEHPTYSHDIPGEFMGQSKYPIPYELMFPDTLKAIRENPKQAPHEFGSLKMIGPRQTIDQQMIDEIKMYEEAMKRLTGKKKGGKVKKPMQKAEGGEIRAEDLSIEERPL